MITDSLKNTIDKLWLEFHTGGITAPLTVPFPLRPPRPFTLQIQKKSNNTFLRQYEFDFFRIAVYTLCRDMKPTGT